jgi:ribosomal protein L6P/L9E
MSRIGRLSIPIPAGVKVSVSAEVSVEGKQGKLQPDRGPNVEGARPMGSA